MIEHIANQRQSTNSVDLSPEYERLFYVTIFTPFIGRNTPIIKIGELENANKKPTERKKRSASPMHFRPTKLSPRRGVSLPRGVVRPWWESRKFISNAIKPVQFTGRRFLKI